MFGIRAKVDSWGFFLQIFILKKLFYLFKIKNFINVHGFHYHIQKNTHRMKIRKE